MNLSPDKPMPTLMTLLDERRPLAFTHRRRPHGPWPWITFLLGLALGWILHPHLS